MSDYVLPELVSEILVRLPIKSILRCRCVCKEWCCLISSPNFICKHLCYSSSSPSTLARHYSETHGKHIYTIFNDEETFDLDYSTLIDFPIDNFRVVGVCNGLLCLSNSLFELTDTVIVWNPSIKRAISLHYPLDQSDTSMSALGFGFDSASADYKVVSLKYNFQAIRYPTGYVFPPRVMVFSLSSGMWRPIENDIECCIVVHYWPQVVFRGAVHWVAFRTIYSNNKGNPYRNSILKFDLHTEKFVEMGLPKGLDSIMPTDLSASVVKELFSICFVTDCNDMTRPEDKCAIWVMKEYGNLESWTPLFTLIVGTRISRLLDVKRDRGLLFGGDNGDIISCDSQNYKGRGTTEVSNVNCIPVRHN